MKFRLIAFLIIGSIILLTVNYLAEDPVIAETRTRARQGNALAQIQLADAYAYGLRGVKYDVAESVLWYRKAADQGNVDAQNRLGEQLGYSHPVGADSYQSWSFTRHIINSTEAVKWFRKAAEQGHAKAQVNLGSMLTSELGVERNPDNPEAFKWFSKAAEQGNAEAMYAVGRAYFKGEGTKQNYAKAYQWLSLYAAEMRKFGRDPLNELNFDASYPPTKVNDHSIMLPALAKWNDRFTAQQREDGLRMAREWKPSTSVP